MLEDWPDARIEVLDSGAATVSEALMVENAAALRDAGCSLEEAVTWLSAERATNQIFFTVGNLDYLIKGGRIGQGDRPRRQYAGHQTHDPVQGGRDLLRRGGPGAAEEL